MPQVLLSSRVVDYEIKRSLRARHVRITVYPDLRLVVSAPYFVLEKTVTKFIETHKNWIENKIVGYEKLGTITRLGGGRGRYKKHKEEARIFVMKKIVAINKYYNFSFNRIAIKNSKSRWGSCSKKGNLNFNYKIFFLPDHLADYIITHELCHLKEMNHSKNFWNLVECAIPNWRELRRELRKNIM